MYFGHHAMFIFFVEFRRVSLWRERREGWISGAEIGRQGILHYPKDARPSITPSVSFQSDAFFVFFFFLCLSLSIYLSISVLPLLFFLFFLHSSSMCDVHCPLQPVNVRSASRPSTRCTCSKISLFLHCSILDSPSVPLSLSAPFNCVSFINVLKKKILSRCNSSSVY